MSPTNVKINLFSSGSESSPHLLAEYLRQVPRQEPDWIPAESELENENLEDPLDEMHERMLQPFMPIFQEIPPLDPAHKYTLEDCLFPEEFHYTVKVVEDKMIPVHLNNAKDKKDCMMGAKLPSSIDPNFPVYHPQEIGLEMMKHQPHYLIYPGRYVSMGNHNRASTRWSILAI